MKNIWFWKAQNAVSITLGDQCLEELPRWRADLGSNRFSDKVLGIHFIFTQFVTDSHLIQKASRVGLLSRSLPCGNNPVTETTANVEAVQ